MVTTTEERISERLERLKQGYEKLTDNDNYRQWLKVLATQYSYSINNTILIWVQQPNATMCRGYEQWKESGRQVRKGERAIRIYAPLIRKDPLTDERRVYGFRTVNVFDISQTDGPDIPLREFDFNETDDLDSEDLRRMRSSLLSQLHEMAIDVDYAPLEEGTGGWCRPMQRQIMINSDHGPVRQFKTLLHEAAHQVTFDAFQSDELSHLSRSDHEFLAESCAYVACAWCNLDTEDWSANYLAHYTRTADQLQNLMPTIQTLSRMVIGLLEVANGIQQPRP